MQRLSALPNTKGYFIIYSLLIIKSYGISLKTLFVPFRQYCLQMLHWSYVSLAFCFLESALGDWQTSVTFSP